MYKNNANAPANINPEVAMYGNGDGYTYMAEKHSEKILSSTDLTQPVNIINLFDQTETQATILGSNIDDPKKLPSGTDFLGVQISTRIFLRAKAGQDLPAPAVFAKASELAFRAVLNLAPDQRASFGQFKIAKHFPVISGVSNAEGLAVMPTNQAQSTNVIDIPLPWQSRATMNAKLYLPAWTDANTELVVCTILSGRIVEGPAV